MTHYDLFAGIGGFSLALDEVFYEQPIKHIFCEWESFPTAVLRKHWPDGEFYGDIANLVAHTGGAGMEETRSGQQTEGGRRGGDGLSILTGGFPCQPFSAAGQRRGTADDRYKWPEMFAVIRNVKPDWVIAENVAGLVSWSEGLVLEQVCIDLENEGYEVQPLVIPAVAVNAPHRRDRVWIIANAKDSQRRSGQFGQEVETQRTSRNNQLTRIYPDWNRNWREVAFATCYDGVNDGLPRWMDGAVISAQRYRKERLKAMGNAIAPQVAMRIFEAIKHTGGMNNENA